MPIREWIAGMDYGVGFDSLSGKIRGNSVSRTGPETLPGTQQVKFSLDFVPSHYRLGEMLGVSDSSSLNNAITSHGSESGIATFLNARSIDRYSVILLVRVVVVSSMTRMHNNQLNQEAWDYMKNQGADMFRRRYGDEFVVGFITGGRYIGFIQFGTTREGDSQEIKAAIQANGALGSSFANSPGNLGSTITALSQRFQTSLTVFQEGGHVGATATTISDMIRDVGKFSKRVDVR